jgi:hypothetical protein
MYYEEDELIPFLTDVICHEEDHRAIHEVTGSKKVSLTFDILFRFPFDFKTNWEHFRKGKIDVFGKKKLTSYGEMLDEKDNTRRKMEQEQANGNTVK